MKKVLVVLLALAVAGGSAFAQGWTFNGLASGGIGIFFLEDDDDPRVAPINNDAAGVAYRTQLDARFTNADQNAGLVFRIRAQGDNPNFFSFFDWGYGWLSFQENMIRVYGGRVDNGLFNSLDRMMSEDSGEGLGVLTVIRPMDGLALGFGAFAHGGIGDMTLTGEPVSTTPGAAPNDAIRQARGTFSLRYDMPDFLSITVGLRNASEAGGAGIGWSMPDQAHSGRTNPSQAYLSVAYLADPQMHAAFTARFMNLEEFGDDGDMRFYATFAHTGLVENMGLHLGASFGMFMGDDSPFGGDAAPHVWVWAAVDYAVTERVVPRLDVHYVMGGRWATNQRNHHWSVRDGVTFHEDDMFLNIRPSVQFRVTPAAFLELGAIFNIDLGEDTQPSSWGGAGAHGTNIGAYALVRVAF